jgi:hypothetical protein
MRLIRFTVNAVLLTTSFAWVPVLLLGSILADRNLRKALFTGERFIFK